MKKKRIVKKKIIKKKEITQQHFCVAEDCMLLEGGVLYGFTGNIQQRDGSATVFRRVEPGSIDKLLGVPDKIDIPHRYVPEKVTECPLKIMFFFSERERENEK